MKNLIISLAALALLAGCVDAPADLYGVHRATRERDTETVGHVAHFTDAQTLSGDQKQRSGR